MSNVPCILTLVTETTHTTDMAIFQMRLQTFFNIGWCEKKAILTIFDHLANRAETNNGMKDF